MAGRKYCGVGGAFCCLANYTGQLGPGSLQDKIRREITLRHLIEILLAGDI